MNTAGNNKVRIARLGWKFLYQFTQVRAVDAAEELMLGITLLNPDTD